MNFLKRRKLHVTSVLLLFVLVCLSSCCIKCEAKRSRGSSRSSSRGSTSVFQRNSNRKGSSKEPSVQHPAQDGLIVPSGKGPVVAKPKSTIDTAKKVDAKPLNQASAPNQPVAPPPYSGAPPAYNPAHPPGGAPPAYSAAGAPGQQPIGWNVPNSGNNHQLHSQKTVGNTQSGYPQQPNGAPPAYSPGAYPPAYSPQGSYPNQGVQGGYPHQTPYGHGGMPPPQGGYHGGGYNQMQQGGYGGYGGYGGQHGGGGGYGGYGGGGMMGGFGGMGGGYGALPYERKRGFGSGFGGTMVKVAAGMLIWNMVSNTLMPSRRYQVHNYYNNPETVPQQISLPANVITLCEGSSKDLCISGTIPLCTQNGTIMCVTTMTNTVPCKENTGNCISTTDKDSSDKTASSETLNLPCIANATVDNLEGLDLNKLQTSTTVNATIHLFDGANTQTIFCVTTLAIPAPDELPGENDNVTLACPPGAENSTACNFTHPMMPMMPPPPGYPVGPVSGNPNPMSPDQQQPPNPGYYYGPYGPYGYYPPYGYPYQWPPPPNGPIGPPMQGTGQIPLEGEPGVTSMESATDVTTVANQGFKETPADFEVMDQPMGGPIERVPMNIPVIPKEIQHTTSSPIKPSSETD